MNLAFFYFPFLFSDFFFVFDFLFLLLFSRFSYSCANSSCACGQTGNHSDSGLIDNQNVIKYRTPQALPQKNNMRSKTDSIAPFNEHKSHATRMKATGTVIATDEPIYVNRIQNQSVNYTNNTNNNNTNNNTINDNDYYNSIVNHELIKANESIIINASKMKSNHKLMGKPPSGEKYLRSFFGLSLDEREMPITRERSKPLQSNCNTKRSVGDAKKTPKLVGSPKLLRATSTCDAYPNRGRNR